MKLDIFVVAAKAVRSETPKVDKLVVQWANVTDGKMAVDLVDYLVVWSVHLLVVKMDIVWVEGKAEYSERLMVETMVVIMAETLVAVSAVGSVALLDDNQAY